MLTLRAYKHLGLTGPRAASTPQIGLFDESDDDDATVATAETGWQYPATG